MKWRRVPIRGELLVVVLLCATLVQKTKFDGRIEWPLLNTVILAPHDDNIEWDEGTSSCPITIRVDSSTELVAMGARVERIRRYVSTATCKNTTTPVHMQQWKKTGVRSIDT